VAADDPVLTADDLGLTRGDGVFDATRVVTADDGTSRIDNLSAHLSRFARSIAGVNGAAPDLEAWTALINELVTAWRRPGEAVLKVM
ncbi:aminodeoxychorismate lyase, partial [Salmonella enterica subsp. enterica serovar Typhimurium]